MSMINVIITSYREPASTLLATKVFLRSKRKDLRVTAVDPFPEVEEVEISDIGKQGTKKVRIVAKKKSGEKIVIIRPEDYPLGVS